jgi:small-conductance mechanosensitive channel
MFARPFEIGDWVEIGDREGIVTEISIVNTRIQTFDGEYAMVPNDTVGSSEVINRTRKGRLRIQVDVGGVVHTDVEEAIDVAVEAMRDVDDVLAVPQPMAVLKGFGDSSIVLNLRFWIDKPSARRKWRAQTAVIAAVKSAFDREGITIPFPQRVVSGRSGERGFRADADVPDVDVTAPGDGDGATPDE